MENRNICPLERANSLDSKIRKWFQNPNKVLKPYVSSGMSVLDFGCGTGFLTLEIASLLQGSGRIVSADLQQGMLDILSKKIKGTEFEQLIDLHKCEQNSIGLNEKFDLIIAFYVIHEVPDEEALLKEFYSLLNSNAKVLIVEPRFHVTKNAFDKLIGKILDSGFRVVDKPQVFLSRAVLIEKI